MTKRQMIYSQWNLPMIPSWPEKRSALMRHDTAVLSALMHQGTISYNGVTHQGVKNCGGMACQGTVVA